MKLMDIMTAPWAIAPEKLKEIRDVYATHMKGEKIELKELQAIRRTGMDDIDEERGYRVESGVAIIDVRGVLSKNLTFFSYLFGGTSMRQVGESFDRAMEDPQVHAIILAIDSPGGTVDGTEELSGKIMSGRGTKPIMAWADGMMASGAYWVGSAADKIYISGETAVVGSIGVVATHVDVSKADERYGEYWTEITAGRYKRIASSHRPLSEEGRSYIQDQVDSLYSVFVQSVAAMRGRPVEEILPAADGQIFIGRKAIEAGLADGTSSLSDLVNQLKEDWTMTKSEIREKYPEVYQAISEEGRLAGVAEGVEKGKAEGITEGKSIGAAEERERIKSIEDMSVKGHEELVGKMKWDGSITKEAAAVKILEAEKARQEAMAKALETTGPAPVAAAADPGIPAEDTFEAAVDRLMAEGMSRGKAISKVAQEHPDLHRDYIARANQRAE